jgi:hypothetical protein
MKFATQPHPQAAFPLGSECSVFSPQCSLNRRLCGLQNPAGHFGGEKIYSCLGTNSGFSARILVTIPTELFRLRLHLVRPCIFFSSAVPNTLSVCSFLNGRNQVSHPYKAHSIDKDCKNGTKRNAFWRQMEVWIRGGSRCEWCVWGGGD